MKTEEKKPNFHQELKDLMDAFVNKVYDTPETFPRMKYLALPRS
jgi:hypothetical protein